MIEGLRDGMRAAALGVALSLSPGIGWAQAPDGVDPSLCRALPDHRPAPDVQYVPGIDVRGNAVAPADLPGSAGANPVILDRFEIPITLNFARRMGLAHGRQGVPGDMEVGRLTIDGDRLSFNGQPIDGGSRARLDAACRGYR